jgi:hypothetical protein
MLKRVMFLSLVAGIAMFFLTAGFGCKKAEQPTEAPKSAEQPKAPVPVEGFKVISGALEKGGLGVILSSDKDKVAVAMKKLDTPFKNTMKIKGQIKSASLSGIRNGFIAFSGYFSDKKAQGARAGILIGGKKLTIDGAFVEKIEKPAKFDQGKTFDFELIVNLKEKTVNFNVDGQTVKSRITNTPLSITHIGFVNSSTKTEFSDLQISGN